MKAFRTIGLNWSLLHAEKKSAYSMPEKKKTLINLQWVVVITISYFLFFREGEVVEDPRVYFLVSLFLISVLVLYRLPAAAFDCTSFAYSLVLVDTVLISLGILLHRDRPWDLFLIFFFGLFIAGIGENLLQIVIGCLIVSIISVALSALPNTGVLALDSDLLLRIPFIFGVSLLYGYLAQQVKRETRRLAETQHNLEHLSALHSVTAAASQSLELELVLQEVIKKITEIFHFDCTRIFLFNPQMDELHLKASFETRPKFWAQVSSFRRGQGIVGMVAKTGEPFICEDTMSDPRYREMSQTKVTQKAVHKFFAVFPIKSKPRTVGTIICIGQEARQLTLSEVQLIMSMAGQIGITVENATLFQETKTRAKELSALYSVATVVNRSLNLDYLLRSFMHNVLEIFHFDAARIYRLHGDRKELRLLAHHGFPRDASPAQSYQPGVGLIGKVFETGEPLFFEDIQNDPEFRRLAYKKIALRAGFRGGFFSPITVKDKTVGVMNFVSNSVHPFSSNEVQLITSIVNHVAVAVENAHLYEKTKEQAVRLAKDITERKRTEKELKQTNAELANRERVLRETLSDLKEAHEELKTAQLQLIQAEKLESVGRLAAGVAHEVKNPLAIILQGVNYLSRHLPTNGNNVAMALQEVDNAVKRANSIVRGLLDFSAANELNLNTEELNSMLEQSLLLVRHELARYHVSVVRELSGCLSPVRLDRNKIEQVFVNIYMNAIHAMPEGGTLTVKTYLEKLTKINHELGSREADHFRIGETVVMVDVEDTGTGIPNDQLAEIFDPFFTTKSTGKGTGLGLTVTKKIIDLHGGTINIRNRKEGGVRATIMFKARGENEHEEETDPAY